MTCERHIQISAKTLQKQSQKQALLKDNLIRQESSEFAWQHHNKNGLQKFNSICTQWRNEEHLEKANTYLQVLLLRSQWVSIDKQTESIQLIHALSFMFVFLLCTWSMFHMCGSHPSLCFDKLVVPFTTESEDSALSQRAILGTQVWLWGSQTSRIPPACLFALSRWCHQG